MILNIEFAQTLIECFVVIFLLISELAYMESSAENIETLRTFSNIFANALCCVSIDNEVNAVV